MVAAIVIQALRWQRRRNARTRQDYAQTLGGAGEYPGPPPRHPNMIVLGGANGVCELGDDISELAVPSYGRIPTSDSSRPTTGGKGGELPPKYHELPENTVQRDSKDK
ncbi:hypothetical protein H4R18_003077 [Coemansia javaensis]|uniref:Uncharacterized protein n=1 Tax=Coemansia javaensis TaxID=2761396 RepID=A0A9W8HGI4_9FUNG|nr:hypothetical protein H4R18_003077 [Coemansia javaensis]